MDRSSTSPIPIQKGEKFNLIQCSKNDLEWKQIERNPCAFIVRSLMHAQRCTRLYIGFTFGMLGRNQSHPSLDHQKARKNVFRYLEGMKDHMLTYRRSNHLEVVRYLDSNFDRCVDTRKSAMYFFQSMGKPYGRVRSTQPLQYLSWKLSLWHALRTLFRLIGCETLFQGLGLLIVLSGC